MKRGEKPRAFLKETGGFPENGRCMNERKGIRSAKRWRYADSYEMREEKGPDGRVRRTAVYVGGHLLPEHGADMYARARRRIRVFTAGAALSLIALLSLNGPSVYSGGTFALLPAVAALIPAFYGVMGAVRMPESDECLREDAYRYAHVRVRRSAGGTAMLSGISLLLIAGVLIGKGGFSLPADAVLIALAAAACLCAIVCLRSGKCLVYRPEDPEKEECHEDPADGV